MIQAFPIKPVDLEITIHSFEQRGFVTVPFDYRLPEGDRIPVFYRLIPSYSTLDSSTKKPIIVVINGGPGIAASAYRPLQFDYDHLDAPQNGPLNRFKYLLESYRVLIVDQRGTDGQTIPLDMNDPRINANGIAHYFSSDSQARDYLSVIEEVIPKDEAFFIIAQSYGGMVGMQYLSLAHARRPKGIVFSSSALPYVDIFDAMLSRRAEQLKLNQDLKLRIPDIESKLLQVRKHLESIGFDAGYVNSLYTLLGKGEPGIWEPALVKQLEKMSGQDRSQTEKEINDNLGGVNLLNYILSSANFTPGHTDRTIAELSSKKIPFEPWMIDENWMLLQTGTGEDWKEKFVKAMDENPPPPTPFVSVEALRESISNHQLLFTAAENDAFVPAEVYQRTIQKFQVAGHTQTKTLPGGHAAIFLEEGLKAFKEWASCLSS